MANDFKRGIRVYLETSDYGKGINEMVAKTKKLEDKFAELTAESKKMTDAGIKSGEAWDKNQKELAGVSKSLQTAKTVEANYRSTVEQTEKVLKNLSGVTYKELITTQKFLQRELKDTARGTKEYNTILDKTTLVSKEVTRAQAEMNSRIGAGSKGFSGFIDNMSMMPGVLGYVGSSLLGFGMLLKTVFVNPFLIAVTAIIGLVAGLWSLAKYSMEFGKAVSNLSALTGAVGDDLDFLKDKAKELAKQYGKSAVEIVEAMKLVGSAKPELLSNVQALSEVTASVLTLSKATGMELSDSTRAVTTIMNQFGLSALESERTINVLAAGSKFGAVEVDYLGDSISKVGTVAKSAGLTLEQTTAVMELFGEKGVKAETAGNGFKRILVELQSDTKNYTNGVFDLNKAIDNNQKIAGNNIALQKKFGLEYFSLAQILLQNRDRFEELTKQVTGTNTALEQATVAADNLSGDTDKMSSSWNAFILSLEDGQGPITNTFRKLIQWATEAVNVLGKLTKSGSQNELDLIAESANNRINSLKQLLPLQKDQIKYINEEIQSEQNIYKRRQDRIAQLQNEIDANNRLGGSWTKSNKAKQSELDGLTKSVNRSIAYVNAAAGLRAALKQEAAKIPILENEIADEDTSTKKKDPYTTALKLKEDAYKESQLELMELRRKGEMTEEIYNKVALQTQLLFLEEKKKLQQKFKKDTIDTEMEISNQKLKIQQDSENSVLKILQEANKAELQTIDTEEKAKNLQIKDNYLNGIIPTREQYEQKIEDLEIKSLERRLKAQRDYLALLKKITNPTKEQAQEIISTEATIIATQTSINDKLLKGEEKYQKDKTKLVSKYAKDSILGEYEANKAALDKEHREGLISEEQYQNEKKKLKLQAAMRYTDEVGKVVQAGSDFVNALQGAETASIQADYQKRLSGLNQNDVDYAKQKEQLQYDQAVAELDVQKKYADAQFGMQVAQIGLATASGIMNAWSSSMILGPIAGPIAASIMTALLIGTGAAQISAANSERNKIKATTIESPAAGGDTASQSTGARVVTTPQAASGRWDVIGEEDGKLYRNVPYTGVARTGIISSPTLVGEEPEIVIDNPTTRNIIMNAPWLLGEIKKYRVPQRASGKYDAIGNSPAGGTSAVVQDNSAMMLAALDRMIALLQYLIDNGVKAPIVLSELEAAIALRDKSLKKGSLK